MITQNTMNVISFGKTDTGRKRGNNEDNLLVDDARRLYAVADGMGGHASGETASRLAVETLTSAPGLAQAPADEVVAQAAMELAVKDANHAVLRQAASQPALKGMGTTLTALLIHGPVAVVAHVGDSRAYLLRDGLLRQITNDHSLVAEHVRSGVMSPAQAKTSPLRHVITRAIGIDQNLEVESLTLPLQGRDTFLLCTDGLMELVEDNEIAGILKAADPKAAVERLIDLANDRGGVDNITAVVIRLGDE